MSFHGALVGCPDRKPLCAPDLCLECYGPHGPGRIELDDIGRLGRIDIDDGPLSKMLMADAFACLKDLPGGEMPV